MKFKYLFVMLALIIVSCDDNKKMEADDADDMNDVAMADSLFQRNSEIVMKDIRDWESEKPDYSIYADDFVGYETMYGQEKDSFNLADMKESNPRTLAMMDFKLLEDPVLLPGVNPETKQPDGSVRYYGIWKVTRPATDSTPMRSGDLKIYASYDFDEDGKINYTQMYGDFGGLMNHLMSKDSIAKQ